MIGNVVGNYKIIEKIGEGGMGTVYKGIDLMLEREVAIKALRPELGSQPQIIQRFRSEAVTLAKLNHPNIATLYSFFRQGDYFFMVLEFVRGETLDKIIEMRGAMSCEQAIRLFCQVLEGIDHAHRLGIVHRDIKPANMMLTDTGTLKVLDFGIARVLGSARMTKTGNLIGTIEYMSPEQVRGQESDARSDIYSLGILFYELLTGRVPFASDSDYELMRAQVEQMPRPPREFAPHIPEEVEWAIMCATEKNPEKRFQTAGAFRAAIVESVSPTSALDGMFPGDAWTAALTQPLPVTMPLSTDAASDVPPMTRVVSNTDANLTPAAPTATDASATGQFEVKKRNNMLLPILAGAALLFLMIAGVGSWLLWRMLAKDESRAVVTAEGQEGGQPKDAKEERSGAQGETPAGSVPTPPPGMAYVPGGKFLMGIDDGDEYERPQHSATVVPFFIDLYEVTCEDYEKFVKETGHEPPSGWAMGSCPAGAARKPVTGVTWDDATAYARWAGKRLPSEEEWEFAARGSDARRYPWGNDWQEAAANADAEGIKRKGMADVGEHRGASPFGAFDMVGNAWEWTASPLQAYPGGQLPDQPTGDLKVIRGGYWKSEKSKATATFRRGWPARGESDYQNTGFRCARDVSAP